MIAVRRANERGAVNLGWLNAKHSFSFGDYYDPEHMGFAKLRVINEDRIEPAKGFGTHGHKDMEIVTYMINGALEHKDNMGNGSVIRAGDVQRMSAGTGIRHSEFNHSDAEKAHLLQIWIMPDVAGIEPGWEEKTFSTEQKRNRLCLVASRDARDDSLTVHQSLDLYASILQQDRSVSHTMVEGHCAWIQLVYGTVSVNGESLSAGDGAAIENTGVLQLSAESDAELLLFDMTGI